MSLGKIALSVVTLTSIPDALGAWKKCDRATWKGRVYTVLTLAYLIPVVGVSLAIVSRLFALVYKIHEPRLHSPMPSNNSPSLRSSAITTTPRPFPRTNPYFKWLDSLPQQPQNIRFNPGVPIANVDFDARQREEEIVEDLSTLLEEGRIKVEDLQLPKDIDSLKSQMRDVGWSDEDIAFLLPYLSKKVWNELVTEAAPKMQRYVYSSKKDAFELTETEHKDHYGFCFIPQKYIQAQIKISDQYYTFVDKEEKASWIVVAFRIEFSESGFRFLVDLHG